MAKKNIKEVMAEFSKEREAPGKGKASQEEKEILFATRVPKKYVKSIKVYCALNELTLKDFFTQAILEAMDKRGIK